MKHLKNLSTICFFLTVFLVSQNAIGQTLPKVSLIGEYPEAVESLNKNYGASLFDLCKNDIDCVFTNWGKFLSDMETYSKSIDFDLKSVKIMLQVYWNENGRIDHIVYWLKPESININEDHLQAFFSTFIRHHKGEPTGKKYQHSGNANFPILQ